MLQTLHDFCSSRPEILFFVVLAAGAMIGYVRIGSFSFGITAGTLIAAVAVGTVVDVPFGENLRLVFFTAFMFAVGYRTGPQFVRGLGRSSLAQVAVSLTVCLIGLLTTLLLARLLGLDRGSAAGLASGSLTQSAIIGSAEHAISGLALPEAEKSTLDGRVAVAYAVTYFFGTIGSVIFCRDIAPRLLGINLAIASREFMSRRAVGGEVLEVGEFVPTRGSGVRAYRVASTESVGRGVAEIEERLSGGGPSESAVEVAEASISVAIEAIRRGDRIIAVEPAAALEAGDEILVSGSAASLRRGEVLLGPEIDAASFRFVARRIDVIATRREVVGRTLGEVLKTAGHGIEIARITRGGLELPVAASLRIERGDILAIVGSRGDVQRFATSVGSMDSPDRRLDVLLVGGGMTLGVLIGVISVPLFGVSISMGTGGGALIAGLLLGWLRSVRPTIGAFPPTAQRLFIDLGLNGFIALVGLSAGPELLEALRDYGLAVLLAGVAVTLLPLSAGLLVGRLLRIEPIVLIGAVTGAQTGTAAITAVVDEAKSDAPTIGFTVPFAISNVVLTLWGPVIVGLV